MAQIRSTTRPGGRSSDVRRRVLEAIQRGLEEKDWDSLSIEEIADRAGVNKTTVYRRWLNKEGLVADLLDNIADSHPGAPDRGDIVPDLAAIANYLAKMIGTPFGRSVIVSVVSSSEPGLEAAARRYWGQLFNKVAWIVQRAIDRGELRPEIDKHSLVESVLAPIYLRALITKDDLSAESITEIVRRAVAPHRMDGSEGEPSAYE